MRGRGAFRGRSRGRGRGGRGGSDQAPRWTPKQGDKDALRALKGLREGNKVDEKESIAEFVRLIEEMYGEGGSNEETSAMDTI